MREFQDYDDYDLQEEYEYVPKKTPSKCKRCGYHTDSYCEKYQNWCKFAKEECIDY